MFQLLLLNSVAAELFESSQGPVRQLLRCLRFLLFKILKEKSCPLSVEKKRCLKDKGLKVEGRKMKMKSRRGVLLSDF